MPPFHRTIPGLLNPAGIFGPTPGPDLSGGLQIICRLLDGSIKACPNISFGIVDVPNWLMRVLALFKPSFKDIVAQLGRNKNASNEKAKKLLGRAPRSHEETILASAES